MNTEVAIVTISPGLLQRFSTLSPTLPEADCLTQFGALTSKCYLAPRLWRYYEAMHIYELPVIEQERAAESADPDASAADSD